MKVSLKIANTHQPDSAEQSCLPAGVNFNVYAVWSWTDVTLVMAAIFVIIYVIVELSVLAVDALLISDVWSQ